MKQTTNMARIIGEIQRIARLINNDWFDGELDMDRVIFTVQSSPTAYAHFTPYEAYRVHDKTGERTAVEINLGAGTLDRSIDECCSSLIHELTHYLFYLKREEFGDVKEYKETSRGNVYHNSRFRNEAEKHGIEISYDSRIGWSVTTPSLELVQWCIDLDLQDFRLGRNEWMTFGTSGKSGGSGSSNTDTPKTPKKGNSHVAKCPCCGTKVRYTTQAMPNIICGDCNTAFIEG